MTDHRGRTPSVALYVRISTAEGKQSTENQLRELRRYANAMKWKIARTYIESASGAALDRPELDALLAAAAKREFDTVLVFDLSRLTRRGPASAFDIIRRLNDSKVQFWSMTEEHFRTAGVAGPLLIAIAAYLAQQERTNLVSRISAGLERAKAAGVKLGRPARIVDRAKFRVMMEAGLGVRQIGSALKLPKSTAQRIRSEIRMEMKKEIAKQ